MIHLIDATLLGQTAADLMEAIEADPPEDAADDLELVAVGIVVVVSDSEHSFTRTWCSDIRTYQQIGLFTAALDCAREGH